MAVEFLPESGISVLGSGIEVKALPERLLVLSVAGHRWYDQYIYSIYIMTYIIYIYIMIYIYIYQPSGISYIYISLVSAEALKLTLRN
jgi:hypothetical protein